MREIDLDQIKYTYPGNLIPAIVQDEITGKVLMLGYMNEPAILKTQNSGKVTFYSRSKNRLWTKGEESGNFLVAKGLYLDCDGDALLIKATPKGPICHKGDDTCWQELNTPDPFDFLKQLENIISHRYNNREKKSYTASLFEMGINKIAQKVGEEAVELVIESKDENINLFKGEAADLLFHYLVLLKAKGVTLDEILEVLIERHK